jgi:phosphate transport system permease protein
VLFLAALVSVFTTVGIVYVLVKESVVFFQHVALGLPDRHAMDAAVRRRPLRHHGAAVGHPGQSVRRAGGRHPAGHHHRHLPVRVRAFSVREVAKPLLELLGGVPTIVYGYFALLFVTPLLQKIYPGLPGFNAALGRPGDGHHDHPLRELAVEDAMRAVPMSLREGSYAMGATRFQTALRVVVPAAFSGIAAAYILGISRAVGETMILAVAAGMQPNLTWNPLEPAATITAYIVQVALGDLPHGSSATRPSSPPG